MKSFEATRRILKPAAFLLALVPLGLLLYNFFTDNLSANPLDDITDETGTWTLRFIVITLAVTPVQKISGWSRLATLRRMFGLFAFFYGTLHFFTYLYFDKFFAFSEIIPDIGKRRFILAGFSALVMMVPLALTSTDRMTRLLGGKRWKRLHRLMYFVAVAGVIHYLWLVKSDLSRPLTYGAIVALLLLIRLWYALRPRLRRMFASPPPTARPSSPEDP